MLLEIPGRPLPIPLEIPLSSCCNCGARAAVQPVTTPFKRTTYFLLAGTELTFELELPYCDRCAHTAGRLRHGAFGRLLVAALLFFALLLGSVFVPPTLTARLPESWNVWAAAGIALVVTFLLSTLPRVKPPMTSRRQPVFLRSLERAFSGQVQSIAFGLTNAEYAEELWQANAEAVSAGALQLVTRR